VDKQGAIFKGDICVQSVCSADLGINKCAIQCFRHYSLYRSAWFWYCVYVSSRI